MSHGFNSIVQGQQFNKPDYVYPDRPAAPDEVYDDTLSLTIGGERIELFHGRGETDDATFVWLPERRVLASGDFVIWVFPNAGNPRKVQRYAAEWAAALRRMQRSRRKSSSPAMARSSSARRAPRRCCVTAPRCWRTWPADAGADEQGRHARRDPARRAAPAELLAKPYLLPKYDDPEFLVRGI